MISIYVPQLPVTSSFFYLPQLFRAYLGTYLLRTHLNDDIYARYTCNRYRDNLHKYISNNYTYITLRSSRDWDKGQNI